MRDDQLLRYSRQILLPQIDIEGQNSLINAHVLIIGLGGLGCPAATYLAAAGVGRLTLVDPDVIDLPNLQRQFLYTHTDQGAFKARVAADALMKINPDVNVEYINSRLEGDALLNRVKQADVVLDATDNFSSRFAINEICHQASTPLVSGAAIGLNGQLTVFDHRLQQGPCYRCLYNEEMAEELTCSESGILGPVVGTIGTMQALEAMKLMTGFGESLHGYLLVFDAEIMQWQKLSLEADPDCPVCS